MSDTCANPWHERPFAYTSPCSSCGASVGDADMRAEIKRLLIASEKTVAMLATMPNPFNRITWRAPLSDAGAEEILGPVMDTVVQIEHENGITIDWEAHLPTNRDDFSAREVVNAIGRALTVAGFPNNLETP